MTNETTSVSVTGSSAGTASASLSAFGAAAWIAVALAVVLASPFLLDQRTIVIAGQALIFGLLAMGSAFLYKHNGHLSFGHAVWFGMAGYVMGILVNFVGLSVELAIILSIAATIFAAFLVGIVIVRSPGIAFSMLTLAINVGTYELFNRMEGSTGGVDGFGIDIPSTIFGVSVRFLQSPTNMFVIMGILSIVFIVALGWFERTHLGQLTLAIRENSERTHFIGYSTYLPKVLVFAISASLAAIGGVVFAIYTSFVSPTNLAFLLSGQAVVMAMIGGTAAAWGPVLGALIFFMLRDSLTFMGEHWMLPLGSALILVAVAWPSGIVGAVAVLREMLSKRLGWPI